MNSTSPAQAETLLDLPEGQVAVAAFRRRRTAEEHALVVLSMKLSYWLHPHAGRFYLCVESSQAEAVAEQLEKYRAERRRWPPKVFHREHEAPANPWAIGVYVILLCAFYYGQQHWRGLSSEGVMNTLALFNQGQWWRTITALTLHADIGHLAGNLLSGVCFALLLTRQYGYGLCWLLLLLSGALGNFVTASMYFPEQHLAYGASTALFGGLGILVGGAMQEAFARKTRGAWKHSLLPLAGGVTVLGLTGLGQEKVDVFGHIYGFVCGLVLGLLATGWLRGRVLSVRWQRLCAGLTLALLAAAWIAAKQ